MIAQKRHDRFMEARRIFQMHTMTSIGNNFQCRLRHSGRHFPIDSQELAVKLADNQLSRQVQPRQFFP